MLVFEELELFEPEPFELLDPLDEPLEDWLPEFDAALLPDSSAFSAAPFDSSAGALLSLRLGFLAGPSALQPAFAARPNERLRQQPGHRLLRGGLGHDLLSFGLLGFGIGNGLDLFVFFLVQIVEGVVRAVASGCFCSAI